MDLTRFRQWLLTRGRDEGTARLYVLHVSHALEHANGYAGRLMDKSLAPKTRRTILASLRAWARFNDDAKLEKALKDVKLPPAVRKTPKTPLKREEWLALLDEIDRAEYISDETRAVLGIMAIRGLRVGDVMRLTREEVARAVQTGTLAFEAKGGKYLEYRAKTFMPYLHMLLATSDWKRVENLFTESKNTRKQATANIACSLRTVATHCNIDPELIHPHRLRRTYATYFLKEMEGDPEGLVKLKEHMCWSDLATAAQYVDHVRKDELAEIEERLLDVRRKRP